MRLNDIWDSLHQKYKTQTMESSAYQLNWLLDLQKTECIN